MGEKIVGVRKNERGEIAMLKLNNGTMVSLETARKLAREGRLDSLTDLDENGNWIIANDFDDAISESGNNLDVLPEF
ncbi:DUF3892 domain-containing protein [Sulfoacidibacillus thermotolerans]|uniref:DUF3892 domain-containing protein n=1 Tax=Sulfoacidibacillus thermotolerans TaxID=1765684 RepID=A0A2U3D6B5_SULT2|nr:DUF3892 domain-containing protein [Sulfoacidibacillus thermotolerans]PWI56822.1 hypothetical protein BM613_11760 [Sulfoacidibacillus thermotolerans]